MADQSEERMRTQGRWRGRFGRVAGGCGYRHPCQAAREEAAAIQVCLQAPSFNYCRPLLRQFGPGSFPRSPRHHHPHFHPQSVRPWQVALPFFRLDRQAGLSTPLPLPDMPTGPHVKVLESINGFICLNDRDLTHLYNFSTREMAALPLTVPDFPANLHGEIEGFSALVYDPALKQYAVVKTWILHDGGVVAAHKVLTLGTNSWRTVDDCSIESPWLDCICTEGAIHILTYNGMDKNNVVVTFDVMSKEFRLLLPPGGAVRSSTKIKSKLFRERLALLEYPCLWDDDTIVMYVPDDYGSQAWKELRIVLPNSSKKGTLGTSFFISITCNGYILLFHTVLHRPAALYLLSYNVESKCMKKVQIHDPSLHQFNGLAVLKFVPFDFVDNILSLNRLCS